MRKINDHDEIEVSRLELSKVGQNIRDLIETLDSKVQTLLAETVDDNGDNLSELLSQFEDKKQSLMDSVGEAVGEMEAYYDDRSETWQNGHRGEVYHDWYSSWLDTFNSIESMTIEVKWLTEYRDNGDVTIDVGVPDDIELPSEAPEY
ncbi:hypothetical protein [Photobacterium leiognathi]|uniref:hypothetical protein n=1 Tax=Photobacterium leiognathi TaxID=553611 RepID=UPI002982667C|nr:hypothetical protein [Photobacterium leiognathi]